MPQIFISYRRDDASGHAGRLYDDLVRTFGADQIFMDLAAMDPGFDFVEQLSAAVGSCDVLLAVIGKRWASSVDDHRRRRLSNPEDFVRIEIAAALARNIRVIPVLVQGATIPSEKTLPAPLVTLARRQAHELSDARWRYDVNQLIARLEQTPTGPRQAQGDRAPDPVSPMRAEPRTSPFAQSARAAVSGATPSIATNRQHMGAAMMVAAAVGLVALAAAVVLVINNGRDTGTRSQTTSPPTVSVATTPPTVAPAATRDAAGVRAPAPPPVVVTPTLSVTNPTVPAVPTATLPAVVTATPAPTVTPVPTQTPRALTAEEWVRAYYNAINERRFADAYAVFSQDAQRRQTGDAFQTQFNDLINISVRYVDGIALQQGARGASLVAHTTTVYRVNSAPVTNCWSVKWTLVLEGDAWKRDSLVQVPDNSCDTHP